jgi:predicted Zn-dependent protease
MPAPPMKSVWNAHYLDGKTAARRPATVELMPAGLLVRTEDGETFRWTFREIRQTQGSYEGETVRLERGRELTEAIVIPDADFLVEMHRRMREPGPRFHNPARRRLRFHLTLLAAVSAVGLSAAVYFWGIPALASAVTPLVPVSWEEQLGDSVAEGIAPPEKRCGAPARLKPVQDIVKTLTAPLSRQPYRFRVIILDEPVLNALALPGGTIVVFRGLLEKTDSPEELAGVLAHELQHILKRHTTRALLEQASSSVLIAAVTGDVSGAMAYGLKSARMAGILRYSRRNEEEADVEGMRMILQSGVDPAGMIGFYERLMKEGPDIPEALAFLSTHPPTAGRIERLRKVAAGSARKTVRLLPQLDWKVYREICAVGNFKNHESAKN